MKTIGQQFREAREARGETLSEAAQGTRIKVQQLEGLEADDFSVVPAPTYAKGFIRLYGRHLGLDAEALVEQYVELISDKPAEQVPPLDPKVLQKSEPGKVETGEDVSSEAAPVAAVGSVSAPAGGGEGAPPERPARRPLAPPVNADLAEPRWTLQGPLLIKAVGAVVALLLVVGIVRACSPSGEDDPAAPPPENTDVPVSPLTAEPVLIAPPAEPWGPLSTEGEAP